MRVSGLWRGLYPSIPSNRYAVLASVAAGGVAGIAGLVSGEGFWEAVEWGVIAAGAAFLAWAIAREIDPDDARSAVVALPLALALLVAGRADLVMSTAVLLAARVVVRTTGLSPGPGDLAFLAVVAGFAGLRDGGVVVGAALAAAVAVDASLRRRRPDRWRWAAAVGLLVVTIVAGTIAGSRPWEEPSALQWAIAAIGIGAVLVMPNRPVQSTGDATGAPLSGRRLLLGRGLVAAAGAAVIVAAGGPGIAALGPPWAALVAVAAVGRLTPRVPGRPTAT